MKPAAEFRDAPNPEIPITLISGSHNDEHNGRTFIVVTENGQDKLNLQINYSIQASPFRQIVLFFDWVVAGLEEDVYMYNITTGETIQYIMDLYFGRLYTYEDYLLICSGWNIIAVNRDGNQIWKSDQLGIDGVLIHKVAHGVIEGDGEWNPPGGWRPFSISLDSGEAIS